MPTTPEPISLPTRTSDGAYIYRGQRFPNFDALAAAQPDAARLYSETTLIGRPRGTSAEALAQDWEGAIAEANLATANDKSTALKDIRQDKRSTRGAYDEIQGMLAERTAGVSGGYEKARGDLLASRGSALAGIESGRQAAATAAPSFAGPAEGISSAMRRRAGESAARSTAAAGADYGRRTSALDVQKSRAVTSAGRAQENARRELDQILRGLGQERRGIIERSQHEGPGYGDIANLYATAAQEGAAKSAARSQLKAQAFGTALSLFGGAAGI